MAQSAATTMARPSRVSATNTRSRLESTTAITARQTELMRQRMKETSEHAAHFLEINQKMNAALERHDLDEVNLLNADFASAKASQQSARRTIGEISIALQEATKDIGITLKSAKDYTEEEKAVVVNAEAKAAEAKARLDEAEADLKAAYGKMQFAGIRARAVAAATIVRDTAKSEFDTLSTAIETAKRVREELRQNRLQGQPLEAVLQQSQEQTMEMVGLVRDDIANIEENLSIQVEGGVAITQTIGNLSKEMKEARDRRDELTSQIESLTASRDEVADKTDPEWQSRNSKVLDAVRLRDEAESQHNIAFDLYQNAIGFQQKYTEQEAAQRAALQFNQAFIQSLEAGNRYRDDHFRSYLGVVKSGDLFHAAVNIDAANRRIDDEIGEDTVKQTIAMRNAMITRLKELPQDNARHVQLNAMEQQSEQAFLASMAELIAQAQKATGAPESVSAR